jgi:hypothetical protein
LLYFESLVVAEAAARMGAKTQGIRELRDRALYNLRRPAKGRGPFLRLSRSSRAAPAATYFFSFSLSFASSFFFARIAFTSASTVPA